MTDPNKRLLENMTPEEVADLEEATEEPGSDAVNLSGDDVGVDDLAQGMVEQDDNLRNKKHFIIPENDTLQ